MSDRVDRDFLSDMHEAVQRVLAYTAGMTYEAFIADEKTQDAVIRNLEIIGEAVNASLRNSGQNTLMCPGKIWQLPETD